jgi:hypothetical protein
MDTSIADNRKKRGRPKTGIGPLIGVRLYPDMQARLDAWMATQDDAPSRPEAIRRLLDMALREVATIAKPAPKARAGKKP